MTTAQYVFLCYSHCCVFPKKICHLEYTEGATFIISGICMRIWSIKLFWIPTALLSFSPNNLPSSTKLYYEYVTEVTYFNFNLLSPYLFLFFRLDFFLFPGATFWWLEPSSSSVAVPTEKKESESVQRPMSFHISERKYEKWKMGAILCACFR